MFSNRDYSPVRSTDRERAISAFMSQVYLWMMVGITISGVTAYVIASRPEIVLSIMRNQFVFFGLIIMQFAAVLSLSVWIQRMSVAMASITYALYATLVGVTFSTLFLMYTLSSISSAFFVTSFAFAGLSAFAYTTKKDLSPIGSFCMMGLFGLIGVTLLGLLIPSMMTNSMQLTMSVIGVLVFSGLTAYDTQKIKSMQLQYGSAEQARKGAIFGALTLYLDFINLFLSLLRLVGDRR